MSSWTSSATRIVMQRDLSCCVRKKSLKMLLHLHVDGRPKSTFVGWPVQACQIHCIGHFASSLTVGSRFPASAARSTRVPFILLQFKSRVLRGSRLVKLRLWRCSFLLVSCTEPCTLMVPLAAFKPSAASQSQHHLRLRRPQAGCLLPAPNTCSMR